MAHGRLTGYHETITAAFLCLVAARLRCTPSPTFADFESDNTDLFLGTENALLRHYTRETLLCEKAYAEFVLPDKEPLPSL